MKLAKIAALSICALGIANLASLGTAETAAATALCKTGTTQEPPCFTNKREINAGSDSIKATASHVVIFTNVANITCKSMHLRAEANAATGHPRITAQIADVAFTECATTAGTACTMTTQNLPYVGAFEAVGGGSSIFEIQDEVGAGVTAKCGVLINCTFLTKEAQLSVSNGSPTQFTASNITLTRTGGLCPSTAELSTTLDATDPSGFAIY